VALGGGVVPTGIGPASTVVETCGLVLVVRKPCRVSAVHGFLGLADLQPFTLQVLHLLLHVLLVGTVSTLSVALSASLMTVVLLRVILKGGILSQSVLSKLLVEVTALGSEEIHFQRGWEVARYK